jgi:hypothetical protein
VNSVRSASLRRYSAVTRVGEFYHKEYAHSHIVQSISDCLETASGKGFTQCGRRIRLCSAVLASNPGNQSEAGIGTGELSKAPEVLHSVENM